jgi:hypothetical protein
LRKPQRKSREPESIRPAILRRAVSNATDAHPIAIGHRPSSYAPETFHLARSQYVLYTSHHETQPSRPARPHRRNSGQPPQPHRAREQESSVPPMQGKSRRSRRACFRRSHSASPSQPLPGCSSQRRAAVNPARAAGEVVTLRGTEPQERLAGPRRASWPGSVRSSCASPSSISSSSIPSPASMSRSAWARISAYRSLRRARSPVVSGEPCPGPDVVGKPTVKPAR